MSETRRWGQAWAQSSKENRKWRKEHKKGVNGCSSVWAREKEFVSRWIRGQFTLSAVRKKVGEGAGIEWRAEAFFHCQHGEQGHERRWGAVIPAAGKVPTKCPHPQPSQVSLSSWAFYSTRTPTVWNTVKKFAGFASSLFHLFREPILEHRGIVRKWLSWGPDVLKNGSSDSVLGAQINQDFSSQRLEN